MKNKYWTLAIFPIIAYGLEEGLRWGRETDWNLYYYVYQDYLHSLSSDHEFLFQLIWRSFAAFGVSYPCVITACSVLFIFSLFFFFKPFAKSKEFAYIVPLCVACHIVTSSNLIRWYMAMSFLLIGTRLWLDKKKIVGILVLGASIFIHFFSLAILALMVGGLSFKKVFLKPLIACVVCTLLLFLFDRSILSKFGFIYDLFGMFNRFSGYLDNGYSFIIGKDEGDSGTKSILMSFITFLPYYAFIVCGYKMYKTGKVTIAYYNIVVIASIFKVISQGLELIGRFYYFLDFFVCMVCVYSISYLYKNKSKFIDKVFIVICICYVIRKFIFMCQPLEYNELMLYVWDKRIEPSSIIDFKLLIAE